MKPVLSIVIPALNSVETVDRCLRSVFQFSPAGDIEVILADNGSTDGTIEKAKAFDVQIINVPFDDYVSRVRNQGAKLAQAPRIAFLDSDCLIKADWFETVLDSLADDAVGVVGCRCGPTDKPSWVERVWQRAYVDERREQRRVVDYVPSGSMALRKDLFEELGGFDETLETGEDPDLCRRARELGFDIVEVRGMECTHLGNPQSLGAFYRREAWHGRGVRLRYANGQISGVVVATLIFALGIIGATILSAWGFVSGNALIHSAWLIPLMIPAMFAVARRHTLSVIDTSRLYFIYAAYFLGRARGLATAVPRMILGSK